MIRICSIPGDGIGQEVIPVVERALGWVTDRLVFDRASAGYDEFVLSGTALPESTLESALAAEAVLFGAVGSPLAPTPGYRSPIVALRRALDLYANVRPTKGPGVDLVIFRENTEGMYAGRERMEDPDTAIAERVITRRGSTRIVRAALDYASRLAEPRLTLVHKANVLRVTDGLFREAALAACSDYPQVAVEEMLVDTAAMRLAAEPGRFQVVATTNLYGDILSDVACIHGGGIGRAASANLGEGRALFEPVHGSAPDIAGRGLASPLAAFECGRMMLEWLVEARGRGELGEPLRRYAEALAVVEAQEWSRTEEWESAFREALG